LDPGADAELLPEEAPAPRGKQRNVLGGQAAVDKADRPAARRPVARIE
jgi:hypothetical protein